MMQLPTALAVTVRPCPPPILAMPESELLQVQDIEGLRLQVSPTRSVTLPGVTVKMSSSGSVGGCVVGGCVGGAVVAGGCVAGGSVALGVVG